MLHAYTPLFVSLAYIGVREVWALQNRGHFRRLANDISHLCCTIMP
jgi:hypothetical protein